MQLRGNLVKISDHALEEAKQILSTLPDSPPSWPVRLECRPAFYVTTADDDSVMAFGAVQATDGTWFKIGVLKLSDG